MQSQTSRLPEIDISASLNSYMETLEAWRKNYENVVRSFSEGTMSGMQMPGTPAGMEQGMAAWQKSCMEPLELWRKNFENTVRGFTGGGMNGMQMPAGMDESIASWQKPFETFLQQFQQFMSQQTELCQSFNQRMEEYIGLSAQASQCKSLTDLGQMQMVFFNKLIGDYTDEMRRLGNPFAGIVASCAQKVQLPVVLAPGSEAKH